MSRIPVEMYVPLPIAPHAAREAAEHVIERLAAQTRVYPGLNLTASPGVQPAWDFRITLRARTAEHFFPTFEGTINVTPVGDSCEIWLQGTYEPPLGRVGAQFDSTVLRGAAQSGLRAFLQSFTDDVKRETEASSAT